MLVGSLDAWLPHFRGIEEQVADAVEAAWPVCIGPLQSKKNSMTHEDHITEHLVRALIRNKSLPGRIIYQYPLLSEDNKGNVYISGQIDFVLAVGDDEDVYLACECKRLNIPYKTRTRGLADKYVDDGLKRFVTGQYSNGLPLAMMLGYVMNTRADLALRGIKRAVSRRSSALGLLSERDAPTQVGRPFRFYTTHTCAPGHVIEVTHTLLTWP